MKDSIVREVSIAASRERVWEVITSPEHINQWLWDFAEGGWTNELGELVAYVECTQRGSTAA